GCPARTRTVRQHRSGGEGHRARRVLLGQHGPVNAEQPAESLNDEPTVAQLAATAPRRGLSTRARVAIGVVTAAILIVELVLGWPFLASALDHLRTPRWGLVVLAIVAESASMGMFARMQRRLLHAAGTEVQLQH